MSVRLTLTGRRPSNQGNRSYTLTLAKEPPATKRMLSVLRNLLGLSEWLIGTVVPQSRGRKSLWTPSVDTPLAVKVAWEGMAILSIQSMNTMPFSQAFLIISSSASWALEKKSLIFLQYTIHRLGISSRMVASEPITCPSNSVRMECLSGRKVPGSIDIFLSSQLPALTSRSLLSQIQVSLYSVPSMELTICYSTTALILSISDFSFLRSFFLVFEIDSLMRSMPIEVTSLPTYPTSVYLVASTLTKGASVNAASALHSSVFPHPVGPSIKMLLGLIELLNSIGTLSLLSLFLKATARTCLALS